MSKTWSIVGKTCLITGANRGIGYHTALALAKSGAKRVILACRSLDRGNQAISTMKDVIVNCPGDLFSIVQLDLASFASIRRCANHLIDNENELQVLVNNAGIQQAPNIRQATKDGNELTFQTNYLGHFLLTRLLLPLLQRSGPSRIVIVASNAFSLCYPDGLDIDDLNNEQRGNYTALKAYSQSKLACILFCRQLHRRLNSPSSNGNAEHSSSSLVTAFSLHPGFDRTSLPPNLMMEATPQELSEYLFQRCSASVLFCICESNIEQYSGCYFSDMPPDEGWQIWQIAQDDDKTTRLWHISEQMTNET